jgi:hypothetical protein
MSTVGGRLTSHVVYFYFYFYFYFYSFSPLAGRRSG